MKKTLCMLPLVAFAEGPVIGNVEAQQDPRTRLVKVSYTLTGGPAVVTFDVQLSKQSIGDAHTATYSGSVRKLLAASETPYTFTWDPRKDWHRLRTPLRRSVGIRLPRRN